DVRRVERPASRVVEVLLAQPVTQPDQRHHRDGQRELLPADVTIELLGRLVEQRHRPPDQEHLSTPRSVGCANRLVAHPTLRQGWVARIRQQRLSTGRAPSLGVDGARRPGRDAPSRCGGIWGCVCISELEPEGRAVAVRAVESEGAAVGLDDLAAEREAEAGALDARVPAVGAEELREDEVLLLGRDAEAVVADGHPYGRAVL